MKKTLLTLIPTLFCITLIVFISRDYQNEQSSGRFIASSDQPFFTTRIPVNDNLFEMSPPEREIINLVSNIPEGLEGSSRMDWITAHSGIENNNLYIRDSKYSVSPKQIEGKVDEYLANFKNRLFDVAEKYDGAIEEINGVKWLTVHRGLEFWNELLEQGSEETQKAARIFMSQFVMKGNYGNSLKLFDHFNKGYSDNSLFIRTSLYDPAEKEILENLAKNTGNAIFQHGDYMIMGRGPSFYVINQVISEASDLPEKEKDVLLTKLERIIRFSEFSQIPVGMDYSQGAAAFYSPLGNEMKFVIPSRADLNTFTHEITHARFQKFLKRTETWAKERKLAIPYEITGPSMGDGSAFGGFTNLLNELNSWRIGESFSGGMTDEEILKVLRDSYGHQAGEKAVKDFAAFWNPQTVKDRSVPKIILDSIKRLNGMNDDELYQYGKRALRSSDYTTRLNYINLLKARYSDELSVRHRKLAEQIAKRSVEKDITTTYSRFLFGEQAEVKGVTRSQEGSYKKYKELLDRASSFSDEFSSEKYGYIPSKIGFEYSSFLYFTKEQGITDYERAKALFEKELGEYGVIDDPVGEKELRAIFGSSGDDIISKIDHYLVEINNNLKFEDVWKQFLEKPSYDLRQIISSKFIGELSDDIIRELVRLSLLEESGSTLREKCVEILEDYLSSKGFKSLKSDITTIKNNESQRLFNIKKGVAEDLYISKGRRKAGELMEGLPVDLDSVVAKYLYDGNRSVHKLGLLNLLSEYTYPSEFPEVYKKTVISLSDKNAPKFNKWIARMFFTPSSNISLSYPAWGMKLAHDLMEKKDLAFDVYEFVGEFYRMYSKSMLPGPQLSGSNNYKITKKIVQDFKKAKNKFSKEERVFYDQALDHLWTLAQDDHKQSRYASIFAISNYPGFVTGLEENLYQAIKSDNEDLRHFALSLYTMVDDGALPKIDRYMKSKSFRERISKLSELDRHYIKLRRSVVSSTSKSCFELITPFL